MSVHTLLEKIIFRPVKLPEDHRFSFPDPFEELFFYPETGVAINALHFRVSQPVGMILYFHGNKDNLQRWGGIVSGLLRYHCDIIAIDYRGYGKSTGERSEEALFSDALFCYRQVIEKFSPSKLILFGRSLGTGIASWLGEKVSPAGLILETPYADMHDLLGRYIPSFVYRNLEYRFNSMHFLQKTAFPVLILHGTKDEVVPYKSGKKLFDSMANPNKLLLTIEGGRHNDLSNFEAYWTGLDRFFTETLCLS